MVLRFQHMLAGYQSAQKMINRACRDLCNDSFEKFGELRRQLYIMKNFDLYIDDDMPEQESGYILKALRAKGFLAENAEVVVRSKYDTEAHDAVIERDPQDAASEERIIDIEELLPLSAFDDGNFEEEYEQALNMSDDDDE